MESKSLENVAIELARRCHMVLALNSQFWISSAYRDPQKQQKLYDAWMHGLKEFGGAGSPEVRRARAIKAGFTPANPPGVSKHCHNPADAVDIGAPDDLIDARREAFAKCGLKAPIKDEPWHAELDQNWTPPTIEFVTHTPTSIITESDDDMPRPDDKVDSVVYPDGNKTFLLRDGGIFNAGSEFKGSIHDLDPQWTKNFDEGFSLTAVDALDSRAGYIIGSKSGNFWKFDESTWQDIQHKKDNK